MGRALWMKIGAIGFVALALLIPLGLIDYKIDEREATRAEVVRELAESSVREQTVSGPVLVLPCTDYFFVEEKDAQGAWKKDRRSVDCTRTHYAESLSVNGSVTTENRYRGIYAARFFSGKFQFDGRFEVPAAAEPNAGVTREWGVPLVVLSLRDVRGIRSTPGFTWNGTVLPFESAGTARNAAGIQVRLGDQRAPLTGSQPFSFSMEIAGLQKLHFVPSARQHEVALSADWPHPSFVGRHLPVSREVRSDGFKASWRVSELASEAPRVLAACGSPACDGLQQYAFGVSLIDPVDVYVQANRAIKYGLLFVLLTFAVFFMYEVLRELRIHPVQYGLVGLALAVFFLLLIALSEHISFIYAYLVAASACVALITVYVQAVLKSTLRALGFAGMLTALYTMLYALLRSEDHSLLMGAVLVFGVLAMVMLLTRRVDWYGVGRPAAKPGALEVTS